MQWGPFDLVFADPRTGWEYGVSFSRTRRCRRRYPETRSSWWSTHHDRERSCARRDGAHQAEHACDTGISFYQFTR